MLCLDKNGVRPPRWYSSVSLFLCFLSYSIRATLKCALLQFLSRVVSVIHERACIEVRPVFSLCLSGRFHINLF